jgi:hypothetical protein
MASKQRPDMRGGELLAYAWRLVPAAHEENEACGERHGRKRRASLAETGTPAAGLRAARQRPDSLGGVGSRILLCRGDRGEHPLPKRRRRAKSNAAVLDKLLLAENIAIGCGTFLAALQVIFERERIGCVQLAIGKAIRVIWALFQAAATVAGARAARGTTMQAGRPATSAISR